MVRTRGSSIMQTSAVFSKGLQKVEFACFLFFDDPVVGFGPLSCEIQQVLAPFFHLFFQLHSPYLQFATSCTSVQLCVPAMRVSNSRKFNHKFCFPNVFEISSHKYSSQSFIQSNITEHHFWYQRSKILHWFSCRTRTIRFVYMLTGYPVFSRTAFNRNPLLSCQLSIYGTRIVSISKLSPSAGLGKPDDETPLFTWSTAVDYPINWIVDLRLPASFPRSMTRDAVLNLDESENPRTGPTAVPRYPFSFFCP